MDLTFLTFSIEPHRFYVQLYFLEGLNLCKSSKVPISILINVIIKSSTKYYIYALVFKMFKLEKCTKDEDLCQ